MFCAVDIGNSRTSIGFFEGKSLAAVITIPTLRDGASMSTGDVEKLSIYKQTSTICIASVVPRSTFLTADALQKIYPRSRIRVLSHDDIPIGNSYRHPAEVGTDRLLGSLAAYELYGKPVHKPVIVIDFGTATVFDCISQNGEFLGGAISLGIKSSADHLSEIAAQLPKVSLDIPKRVLGKTTVESMQSGILYGAVGAAEGIVKRLTDEVFDGKKPVIVAVGGLSELITRLTKGLIDHLAPDLVLEGIRITYESTIRN